MKPVRRPIDLAQRLLPFQQAITVPAHATYCVYTHVYHGTVFYIGKGRPDRPFQTAGRHPRWREFVAQHGPYEVSIVFWTDDPALALREETRLIHLCQPVCNVQHRPPPPRHDRSTMQDKSDAVGLMLRLPRPLHQQVKTLAKEGYRPVNSQIILMLEQYLADHHEQESPHNRPS